MVGKNQLNRTNTQDVIGYKINQNFPI